MEESTTIAVIGNISYPLTKDETHVIMGNVLVPIHQDQEGDFYVHTESLFDYITIKRS